MDSERKALEEKILAFIEAGCERRQDQRFGRLALELFRFQYRHNDFYRRFVDSLGASPSAVRRWEDIPCLPVTAFKAAKITSFPDHETRFTFRTSGTTEERRGELHLDDLKLYERSLLGAFKYYGLADRERIVMASLIPPFEQAGDSSLSYMISRVFSRYGAESSAWFSEGNERALEKLSAFLTSHEKAGSAVMLFGTAIGLSLFLEYAARYGLTWRLAEGSRLMETGGSKGRKRVVSMEELHGQLSRLLGIREHHVINEYGMTEMGSQFYDAAFRNKMMETSTPLSLKARWFPARDDGKKGPPWVRTRVVDPRTGREAAEGEQGILCHYDLANVGSVMALETEDLGFSVGNGFRIIGRIPSSELRGCSLATEEPLLA